MIGNFFYMTRWFWVGLILFVLGVWLFAQFFAPPDSPVKSVRFAVFIALIPIVSILSMMIIPTWVLYFIFGNVEKEDRSPLFHLTGLALFAGGIAASGFFLFNGAELIVGQSP